MSIKCCHPCKPPVRYPGCHDHCERYIEEKAQNEMKMAAYKKKKAAEDSVTNQKYDGVRRAYKRRRKR